MRACFVRGISLESMISLLFIHFYLLEKEWKTTQFSCSHTEYEKVCTQIVSLIEKHFHFFPTGWMVENKSFQNHALLRKRPWSVKSTQVFSISYMYSLLFHQNLSPPLEGPTELWDRSRTSRPLLTKYAHCKQLFPFQNNA